MDSQRLKFSVHDGDLKAGSGRCDDIVYWQALDRFNALEAPAMFTAGDNDWTVCDRTAAGSFNSLERLDFERRLFCSNPYSIGKRHGDSHCFHIDKPYLDAAGRRLENFTRVETFGNNQANGANDVQWLKVWVDPRSREVFSYQPMIVPGNRVAVPAP
jgi:hypothetical protein